MSTPKRITWIAVKGKADVAMVVEEEHQSDYARIVTLRDAPATEAEIEAWRFPSSHEGKS